MNSNHEDSKIIDKRSSTGTPPFIKNEYNSPNRFSNRFSKYEDGYPRHKEQISHKKRSYDEDLSSDDNEDEKSHKFEQNIFSRPRRHYNDEPRDGYRYKKHDYDDKDRGYFDKREERRPKRIKKELTPLSLIREVKPIQQQQLNPNFTEENEGTKTYLFVTSEDFILDENFGRYMEEHGHIERKARLDYTSMFVEFSNYTMAFHAYEFAINQQKTNPKYRHYFTELKDADFVQNLIIQRIKDLDTKFKVPRILILHDLQNMKDLEKIMRPFEDIGLKDFHRDGRDVLTYHKSLASIKDFYKAFDHGCALGGKTYVTECFNTAKIKQEVFNIIRQKLITECMKDCNQMLITDLYVHTLKRIKFHLEVIAPKEWTIKEPIMKALPPPSTSNFAKQTPEMPIEVCAKPGNLLSFSLTRAPIEFRLTQIYNMLGKAKKASKERKDRQRKKNPENYKKTIQDQMSEIVDKIEFIRQPDLEGPCARLSPIRRIKESRKREYLRPYARSRLQPLVVARNSGLKIRQSQWPSTREGNGRRVYFEKSAIQGYGLFAAESISQDSLICEYNGEIIRSRVADLREKQYEAKGFPHMFLFRIDNDSVIDATMRGGISRFLNHSCHPNCRSTINIVDNTQIIAFYAEKNIKPHEEICFNYKLEYEDRSKRQKCFCGAKECLGYLNYKNPNK